MGPSDSSTEAPEPARRCTDRGLLSREGDDGPQPSPSPQTGEPRAWASKNLCCPSSSRGTCWGPVCPPPWSILSSEHPVFRKEVWVGKAVSWKVSSPISQTGTPGVGEGGDLSKVPGDAGRLPLERGNTCLVPAHWPPVSRITEHFSHSGGARMGIFPQWDGSRGS